MANTFSAGMVRLLILLLNSPQYHKNPIYFLASPIFSKIALVWTMLTHDNVLLREIPQS